MCQWYCNVQTIVTEIDRCIRQNASEELTLTYLAEKLGYSECYTSRKFREISGVPLREYLHQRKLAFALKELRDTEKGILEIALNYGFSSHEAFTRAFKEAYGVSPGEYRRCPTPVVLRTTLNPFDCYLAETDGVKMKPAHGDVKTYFVSIPAHKYLHIRNYESIGYWDFWQKQSRIPGQDCDTICGLLDMGWPAAAWIQRPGGCSISIMTASAFGSMSARSGGAEQKSRNRQPLQIHRKKTAETGVARAQGGLSAHGPFAFIQQSERPERAVLANLLQNGI